MIEAEIDITEAMESFSKAAKSHDLSSAVRENLDEIGRLLTMNVNLRNILNIELAKLRYLGKRAVKKENYPSFNMVAKLWKERD